MVLNNILEEIITSKNLIEHIHYDKEVLNQISNTIIKNNDKFKIENLYIVSEDTFFEVYYDEFIEAKKECFSILEFGMVFLKDDVINEMIPNVLNNDDSLFDIVHCEEGEYVYLFYT